MTLDYFIYITLGLNTLISLVVLFRDRKALLNRYYFAFVTFLDLWIVCNILQSTPGIFGAARGMFFLHLDFALLVALLYAWYRFCRIFVKSEFDPPRAVFLDMVVAGLSILFAACSLFSSTITARIFLNNNIIRFESGFLWIAYAVFVFAMAGAGLLFLLIAQRRAQSRARLVFAQQIDFIFGGFLIAIGNALVINVFLEAIFPVPLAIARFGLYGMMALTLLTAYGMIRRRLFDVKFLIVRTFSFFVFIVALAAAYGALFVLGIEKIFGGKLDLSLFVVNVAIFIAGTFIFQPLYRFIKKKTNAVFFQDGYDSDDLLYELTHIMSRVLDLEKLESAVLEKLVMTMNVEGGVFLNLEGGRIRDMFPFGLRKNFSPSDVRPAFIKKIMPAQKLLVYEELEDVDLKDAFQNLEIASAMPICIEDEVIAILLLGAKLSGDPYGEQDIQLLNIFGSESGIAIQNAKSYKAIERRVAERTKQLEDSEKEQIAKAEEVSRLKDEFVFFAVHELRAPATAINGFLKMTTSGAARIPKAVRSNLDAMAEASDHLSQLVNDLLEIARSDSGTITIAAKPCEILPVLQKVLDETKALVDEKKISVFVDIPPYLAAFCDEQKLKEVFMNLVTNAIKYNKSKGKISITAKPDDSGKNMTLEVADTGFGIPKEQQPKIFQKFFRATTKETQDILGTGLGLFICRMLVNRMGGTISFASTEGKGTVFVFSLPAAMENANSKEPKD
jgi:signal transduction histidine kinase